MKSVVPWVCSRTARRSALSRLTSVGSRDALLGGRSRLHRITRSARCHPCDGARLECWRRSPWQWTLSGGCSGDRQEVAPGSRWECFPGEVRVILHSRHTISKTPSDEAGDPQGLPESSRPRADGVSLLRVLVN